MGIYKNEYLKKYKDFKKNFIEYGKLDTPAAGTYKILKKFF